MAYANMGALPLTGVAVWNGYVVKVGGSDETNSALIQKALVSPDGKLGAWSTIAQLPVAKLGASVLVNGQGLMYVVGGVQAGEDDGNVGYGQVVYKLQLDENANAVSQLIPLNAIPVSVVNPSLVLSGGYLYASGGATVRAGLSYDGKPVALDTGSAGPLVGLTSGQSWAILATSDSGATGSWNVWASTPGTLPSYTDNEIVYDAGALWGRALVNGATSAAKLDFASQVTNFTNGTFIGVFTDVTDLSTRLLTASITSHTDAGATGVLTLGDTAGTNDEQVDGLDIAVRQGVAVMNGEIYQTLAYDNQTVNFTVGETITGGTSNATAVVYADTDAGATGVLKLTDVTGTFQNDEEITGDVTGVADVDGTISASKIDYDAQTENFTTTARLFGVTSGATAVIDADTDAGATGTLTLSSVSGTFADNEALIAYSAAAYAACNSDLYVTVAYDGRAGTFVVGETVTGVTSGATLVLTAVTSQVGATGTLSGVVSSGTFDNNETIYSSGIGSAVVDGTLTLESDLNTTGYRARIMSDGSIGIWEAVGTVS